MKPLIQTLTLSLILLFSQNIHAFTIMTNVNELRAEDLTNENGQLDFSLLGKIKSDGVWCVHNYDYTDDEKQTMYNILGPGLVGISDGSYMTYNYEKTFELNGYVDYYMSYNEPWMYGGWRDRFVSYDPTNIWAEQDTILADIQIDDIYDKFSRLDTPEPDNLIILTRDYTGRMVDVYDHALNNPRVGGAMVEMWCDFKEIDNRRIDVLANKALSMGKDFLILLTPGNRYPFNAYEVNIELFMDYLRKTLTYEQVASDHLIIIISNYKGDENLVQKKFQWKTSWFGEKDSVEATIKVLKNRCDWSGSVKPVSEPVNKFEHYNTQENNIGCFISTLF